MRFALALRSVKSHANAKLSLFYQLSNECQVGLEKLTFYPYSPHLKLPSKLINIRPLGWNCNLLWHTSENK